jgi:ribonuclease T2
MLDLMPSPRLIFHEWDRHGTCSGLTAANYFDMIRRARAAVKIPSDFSALEGPASISPVEIVSAFLKANPTLPQNAISVACDARRLTEVRFCLGKDLSFRGCPDIARHSCRRDNVSMPAMRGR